MKIIVATVISLAFCLQILAQENRRVADNRCGTMQVLEEQFKRDPAFKKKFELQRIMFNNAVASRIYSPQNNQRTEAIATIPVVFHVVLPNGATVSDQQLMAQIDTLNKDYGGTNGDSVNIPPYFKPLFGKSIIRFCLAQQDPNGLPTTGINYYLTTQTSFPNDNTVKHAATGGADAWNTQKYLNIWICPIANNILGFSTFPNDNAPADQGVVIDYRAIPGGSYTGYNGGKTATHEVGHYFNLYHIWGDDNGGCNGTDFIDDTPNQADFTADAPVGVKTDNCTTTSPGIMYQNFMDYTRDSYLVLFTITQVSRMEAALSQYRSSLLTSGVCSNATLKNLDVQLTSIDQPVQRICNSSFTPGITIKNAGVQTITSLTISSVLDNGNVSTFNWTGSLASLASTTVSLSNVNVSNGSHIFTVTTSKPNGLTDENTANDVLTNTFMYQTPLTTDLQEGFESNVFPPAGWDIINTDNSITWQRITNVAKTGNASVYINNFQYSVSGRKDYLRLPDVDISNADSAFFSFQVAAAAYTPISAANNVWDTLEVVVSADCGKTYNSVYKKWGPNLVTRTSATTDKFIPTASEWRKDSVNLAAFSTNGRIIIAFLNTSGFENNIYLDDINLRRVSVNPNLKEKGVLITPNPTNGNITVQFYPQPVGLQAIQIYAIDGRKVAETLIKNELVNNVYRYNLDRFASGVYFVRLVFNDKVITRQIIKATP